MKPNFDIALLPEAIEFLEKLDDKTREKIYYNIKKAQFMNDNELLIKNSTNSFGNFGLCTTAKPTDYSTFGIGQIKEKY
jgi:hypothetical protein